MDKTLTEIEHGVRAQALLGDELLKLVFEEIRQEAIDSSLTLDGYREDDIRARESYRMEVKAIESVRRRLQSKLDGGKFARARIET